MLSPSKPHLPLLLPGLLPVSIQICSSSGILKTCCAQDQNPPHKNLAMAQVDQPRVPLLIPSLLLALTPPGEQFLKQYSSREKPVTAAIRFFRLVYTPGGGLGSAPGPDCRPLPPGWPLYAYGPCTCTGLRRPANPVPLVSQGCAHVGS